MVIAFQSALDQTQPDVIDQMQPPVPLVDRTPEQWITKLWKRMDERTQRIQLFEDYFLGKQRLRFTTLKMRETFGNEFGAFAANYCLLVVNAIEERLRITGFRVLADDTSVPETPAEEASESPTEETAEDDQVAQSITNDEAWRIWRANDMEAAADLAHNAALVCEEAYALVWANPDDPETPSITVESPFQMITDDVPGSTHRRAALKRWIDDDDGKWRATLYLPDAIWKYTSRRTAKQSKNPAMPDFWEKREEPGEPWPLPNALHLVPVVPLRNNPRLGPGATATSEIAAVIPIQDAINKTITDMLIASEFAAFPQRYMVGVGMPKDENDQPMEPFKAGVDRIWFIETPEGATISPTVGQFAIADLGPYVTAVDRYIASIGSISSTPKHYLIDAGGGTNLSGETVKALEAGLVAKARRKHRVLGDAWEEVMALVFTVKKNAGQDVPTTNEEEIQIQWADPESRTESQHIDALLKLALMRVPTEQLWLDAGYSPQDVERFKAMLKASPPPTQAIRPTEQVTPGQVITEAPVGPLNPAVTAGAPATPMPAATMPKIGMMP